MINCPEISKFYRKIIYFVIVILAPHSIFPLNMHANGIEIQGNKAQDNPSQKSYYFKYYSLNPLLFLENFWLLPNFFF